jgi:cysteine-rich secretory family protein
VGLSNTGICRAFSAGIAAVVLMLSAAVASADSSVDLISAYRLKHGEAKVVRDATLDHIALEQARAMAEKGHLSHDVLGPFSRRIALSKAGRAAENIAYGYESFDKTLQQWIDSSEHRKNLLLTRATRVGIASARDVSGKRTYWAMEIAGDYEPKPRKGKDKGGDRLIASAKEEPAVKREAAAAVKKAAVSKCHISLLGLCL